jgi:transcriptional regulator GlxA family with amidase domain
MNEIQLVAAVVVALGLLAWLAFRIAAIERKLKDPAAALLALLNALRLGRARRLLEETSRQARPPRRS